MLWRIGWTPALQGELLHVLGYRRGLVLHTADWYDVERDDPDPVDAATPAVDPDADNNDLTDRVLRRRAATSGCPADPSRGKAPWKDASSTSRPMASSKRVVRDETNVPAKMIVTLSASVTGLRHCGGTGQSTRPIHADPDSADDAGRLRKRSVQPPRKGPGSTSSRAVSAGSAIGSTARRGAMRTAFDAVAESVRAGGRAREARDGLLRVSIAHACTHGRSRGLRVPETDVEIDADPLERYGYSRPFPGVAPDDGIRCQHGLAHDKSRR